MRARLAGPTHITTSTRVLLLVATGGLEGRGPERAVARETEAEGPEREAKVEPRAGQETERRVRSQQAICEEVERGKRWAKIGAGGRLGLQRRLRQKWNGSVEAGGTQSRVAACERSRDAIARSTSRRTHRG